MNIHFRKDNASQWEVQIEIDRWIVLATIAVVAGIPIPSIVELLLQQTA